jgi:MipA family protein
VFTALSCHADLLPLWEAGAGLAVIDLPDYRGSAVRSTRVLPAPYLIYRGNFLKADRNGVRAAFFESDRLELNLSLNATLAASSKNNPARGGMPALKSTIEIGPTADVALWNSADNKAKLDMRMPIRAAITVESHPRHIGWLFSPNLNLNMRDPFGYSGWKLGMQTGPVFGTRRYHGYFYDRADYAAPGGFAGTQLTTTLSKRFAGYWAGAYLRYDSLHGAVFADSPLVQRRNAVTAGIALTWVFGVSSTMVEATE